MSSLPSDICESAPGRKNQRLRIIILILLGLFLIYLCADLYISNSLIKVNNLSVDNSKVNSTVRIGVVSDLHNKKFRNSNQSLYDNLRTQEPHIILTVGDMLGRNHTEEEDIEYLQEVLMKLSQIAPVYSSLGNHELDSPMLEDIRSAITASGATLLDKDYTDITINDTPLRIGGLSYYRDWDSSTIQFLYEFSEVSDDRFTLLLCHFPEYYEWGIENFPVDLMVSGHTHGGMIRLPFVGGLIAPDQGLFPEYDAGLYDTTCGGKLAITTGLGSSPSFVPRFNNRPEIMIIDVN
ncbi:MAG: metallophosphoesterase [Ruminococcus sp.]|nr:metallophosphoesterase [Ruminococcus sp.]